MTDRKLSPIEINDIHVEINNLIKLFSKARDVKSIKEFKDWVEIMDNYSKKENDDILTKLTKEIEDEE